MTKCKLRRRRRRRATLSRTQRLQLQFFLLTRLLPQSTPAPARFPRASTCIKSTVPSLRYLPSLFWPASAPRLPPGRSLLSTPSRLVSRQTSPNPKGAPSERTIFARPRPYLLLVVPWLVGRRRGVQLLSRAAAPSLWESAVSLAPSPTAEYHRRRGSSCRSMGCDDKKDGAPV